MQLKLTFEALSANVWITQRSVNEFQTVGPATEKACPSNISRYTYRGIDNWQMTDAVVMWRQRLA